MKTDWREVLRGVKVADLERHPARYRREPYRTAIREWQAEWAKIEESTRPIRDTIERNKAVLHEWIDDPVFGELGVADIARRLDADASIRGRVLAEKRQPGGPRNSKYTSEHPAWERAKREELSANPRRSNTKLITAIIKKTGTPADRRTVGAWLKKNKSSLRS